MTTNHRGRNVFALAFVCLGASLFDLFEFRGMALSALFLLFGILFVPYLLFKKRRNQAAMYLAAVVLAIVLDLCGAIIINKYIIADAYQFRSELTSHLKLSGQYPSANDKTYQKRYCFGYPILYSNIDDGGASLMINLFNYKVQSLNVRTGALGTPVAND